MLTYTLLIMSAPYNTHNVESALNFVKFLMKNKKNSIQNIFFYGNGVLNANKMILNEKKEKTLSYQWYKLSKKFSINLNVCSTSAQERGIISKSMNKNFELLYENVHDGFNITGLGCLIKSILNSDRILQF